MICVPQEKGDGTLVCKKCGKPIRKTLPGVVLMQPCGDATPEQVKKWRKEQKQKRVKRRKHKNAKAVIESNFPCVHRGEKVRDGVCNLCGSKGEPFEILSCAKFGECSILTRHTKVKHRCLSCSQREEPVGLAAVAVE